MESPLERMIDEAVVCGTCGAKGLFNCTCVKKPPHKQLIREEAYRVAEEVIHHLDTMYPNMWDSVPKTARRSVKSFIINRMITTLTEFPMQLELKKTRRRRRKL